MRFLGPVRTTNGSADSPGAEARWQPPDHVYRRRCVSNLHKIRMKKAIKIVALLTLAGPLRTHAAESSAGSGPAVWSSDWRSL